MTVLAWLRQPEQRAQLPARLLLGVAIVWGLLRTARSLAMLFEASHDLNIYYSLWFLLGHRDYADIALSQALYLPHTWLVLTPFFLLGWPAARLLMLLLNVGCVFYIWWRLSELAGLQGMRRWLLLVFLWDWLCTGLVIGLGNLALVCVAAALAAYPFSTVGSSVFLTLSAMKQTLVFPLYFRLLLKRPKMLIVPFVVVAVCGVAVLVWARLGLADALGMARGSVSRVAGLDPIRPDLAAPVAESVAGERSGVVGGGVGGLVCAVWRGHVAREGTAGATGGAAAAESAACLSPGIRPGGGGTGAGAVPAARFVGLAGVDDVAAGGQSGVGAHARAAWRAGADGGRGVRGGL